MLRSICVIEEDRKSCEFDFASKCFLLKILTFQLVLLSFLFRPRQTPVEISISEQLKARHFDLLIIVEQVRQRGLDEVSADLMITRVDKTTAVARGATKQQYTFSKQYSC